MPAILTQALILIAVYAIVWQGYKLRRRFSGFAHVALLVFIVGTVLPQIVGWLVLHDRLRTDYGSILADIAVTVPVVALFCFRLALQGRAPRDGRVLVTIGFGVALCAITIVLGLVNIGLGAPLRMASDGAEYAAYPLAAVSAVINSLYRTVMIGWFGLWVFPFTARPGTAPRLRLGMRVAASGILAMGCVCALVLVNQLATVIVGHPVHGSLLLLMVAGEIIAGACWAIGLSYPLVASRASARRVSRTQRRDILRLRPLWNTGLQAFPEIARPGDDHASEPVDFQLQRLKAECYDCLHHLRLYENSTAAAASREAAEHLIDALERYEANHGESVWEVMDDNRADDSAQRDLALLIELADLVALGRSTPSAV